MLHDAQSEIGSCRAEVIFLRITNVLRRYPKVKRGCRGNTVQSVVRSDAHFEEGCYRGDLPYLGEAAAYGGVRLDDIDMPFGDQPIKLPAVKLLLARRYS